MQYCPKHLHVDRHKGLTAEWADGKICFYPVAHLRKMSPSADMRELREQMQRNPLTVLPASNNSSSEPLTITNIEPVGNYAVKLIFSDGHTTGLYSWDYLYSIAPESLHPLSD